MKKIIFILIFAVIFTINSVCAETDFEQTLNNIRLMDYGDYKNISLKNIKSLKIIRYTEAGVSEKTVDDKNAINQIYNYLSRIIISDEAKMGCTDNTIIYLFTLKNNKKVSVEIECEWIVIKGKNYNFKINN